MCTWTNTASPPSGDSAGGDRGDARDPVPDAAHLDEQLPVGQAVEDDAAQRADHRAPPPRFGPGAAPTVRVTDGQRQGVGGVGGLRALGQAELGLHHALHLQLGGGAVPGDGQLHLVGRVLHHLAPGLPRRGQRQPAGLTDRHGRADVGLEEHLLDGDRVGPDSAMRSLSSAASAARRAGSGSVTGVVMTPAETAR